MLLNKRTSQLPAINKDKRRGQRVYRVDKLLRETRPVLIG